MELWEEGVGIAFYGAVTDDDWKVSFILTICCGWTQVKWRTKLFHNSDSSWLERVLDTQAQGGGAVGAAREANFTLNIINNICFTLTSDCKS